MNDRHPVTPVSRKYSFGGSDLASLAHVYLLIGQGGVFHSPTVVQTVLGSCVAVTMHCPKTMFGGIFHALLPRAGEQTPHADRYRFVDSAIRSLVGEFHESGIHPRGLAIKVFGGGSPLDVERDVTAGRGNAETALEVLDAMGLRPTAVSVGGNVGRKLFFRTDTGDVFQKRFAVRQAA